MIKKDDSLPSGDWYIYGWNDMGSGICFKIILSGGGREKYRWSKIDQIVEAIYVYIVSHFLIYLTFCIIKARK